MYIPLDLAKRHLNIEADYTQEDEFLLGLIGVCEQAVEKDVNEKLSVIAQKNGGCIPAPLFQAMLLLLGSFYQNRETIAPSKIKALPYNYEYLINLWRNFVN